jgi:hypothetical protein
MRQVRRELLLTTLIDLLVQMVFICLIIMIVRVAAQARESSGGNGGYLLDKAWQLLHDANHPAGSDPVQHAIDIVEERESQKARIAELERTVSNLNQQMVATRRAQGRAPGRPTCVDSRRQAVMALRFVFNADGTITAERLGGWPVARAWLTDTGEANSSSVPFGRPQSPEEFRQTFGAVARQVRGAQDCTLKVEYRLAPGISGDVLQGSILLVGQYFRPQPEAVRGAP